MHSEQDSAAQVHHQDFDLITECNPFAVRFLSNAVPLHSRFCISSPKMTTFRCLNVLVLKSQFLLVWKNDIIFAGPKLRDLVNWLEENSMVMSGKRSRHLLWGSIERAFDVYCNAFAGTEHYSITQFREHISSFHILPATFDRFALIFSVHILLTVSDNPPRYLCEICVEHAKAVASGNVPPDLQQKWEEHDHLVKVRSFLCHSFCKHAQTHSCCDRAQRQMQIAMKQSLEEDRTGVLVIFDFSTVHEMGGYKVRVLDFATWLPTVPGEGGHWCYIDFISKARADWRFFHRALLVFLSFLSTLRNEITHAHAWSDGGFKKKHNIWSLHAVSVRFPVFLLCIFTLLTFFFPA